MATIEQQKALAMASARLRTSQTNADTQIEQESPKTKSEAAMQNLSHLSYAGQLGEGVVSTVGKIGTMAVAGLAGLAQTGKEFVNAKTWGELQNAPGRTEVVESIQQKGAELFDPKSPGGKGTVETLGKGVEMAGTAIKYPLSAVPFAVAGLREGGKTGGEERKEFMEMPMSQYLGELAQDYGASPLFATMAHMVPDALLTAAWVKTGKAATAPAKAPKPKAPTVEQLKADSGNLYRVVDEAGITIADAAFQRAVGGIIDDFFAAGGRGKLNPKTWQAIKEFKKDAAAGGVTLSKVEELRRVMGQARNALEPADRASASRAIHALDDFMETGLTPAMLTQSVEGLRSVGVVGAEAAEYLKSARSLWARARKTEMMEEMIETAGINAKTYTGAGFENALRIQFKQLARKLVKDKRVRSMYTPAERAAIKKVAMGTPVGNVLTWIGKAAPTGVVSAGISGGAGFMVAGPTGALVVPAVGTLARWGATRMSLKNAESAAEMMARGSP